MRKVAVLLALMGTVAFSAPAMAGNPDGKVQVKVLGTAVLPSGSIEQVKLDLVGLPPDTQTEASNNFVPTLAVEYFFTPNISLETICCMTEHHVTGTTGMPGAELVSNAKIIPATFTLKYHPLTKGIIQPYFGAGPAYFIAVSDRPGPAAIAAKADDFKLDSAFGVALQAGVDIPVSDQGFSISLDAKKYFVRTDAHWYANGAEVIHTRHKLDPWLLSFGVGYRF